MKSSYYPPRARLPSASSAWFELRRALRLERIHPPGGVSFLQVLLGLLIPGYAFIATGRRHSGRLIITAYFMATAIFFILLGYSVANILFGLLVAVHAVSILWMLRLWIDRPPLWLKVAMVVTLVTLLGMTAYWPSLQYLEENWFMPLTTRNGVVVVKRNDAAEKIRVGDLIACRIDGQRSPGLRVEDGFAIERVLARSADRIEFTPTAMLVNGKPHPKERGMPEKATLIVPPNVWFVWPNLDIQLNGDAGEAMVTAALLRLATVSHHDYIGKPYRHWFGRPQNVP